MSEQAATKNFRKHLVSAGAHCQRIEDKLTEGVPDMNVSLNGTDFWAEGKFLKALPARRDTLIRFGKPGEKRLANQRNWLMARLNAGGLCFWWLRVGSGDGVGWYIFDEPHTINWIRDGVSRDDLEWWAEFHRFPTVNDMVSFIQEVLVPNHREGV